jgi:hypothetical protein
MSDSEYHCLILRRCADYVKAQRPEWIVGMAAWGLDLDNQEEYHNVVALSESVDYLVEVRERTVETGIRRDFTSGLKCAFGSVGGVFVSPPQHWERHRWFLPCGLRSARSLRHLHEDGGQACEYFYRPFANPGEEVSWRTGARVLSKPDVTPEDALTEAIEVVYGATGSAADKLASWYKRAEDAYFNRSTFRVGQVGMNLEPLVDETNPAAPGPPVYLRDRLTSAERAAYAVELTELKQELADMGIPNRKLQRMTIACIEGTLADIAQLD